MGAKTSDKGRVRIKAQNRSSEKSAKKTYMFTIIASHSRAVNKTLTWLVLNICIVSCISCFLSGSSVLISLGMTIISRNGSTTINTIGFINASCTLLTQIKLISRLKNPTALLFKNDLKRTKIQTCVVIITAINFHFDQILLHLLFHFFSKWEIYARPAFFLQ